MDEDTTIADVIALAIERAASQGRHEATADDVLEVIPQLPASPQHKLWDLVRDGYVPSHEIMTAVGRAGRLASSEGRDEPVSVDLSRVLRGEAPDLVDGGDQLDRWQIECLRALNRSDLRDYERVEDLSWAFAATISSLVKKADDESNVPATIERMIAASLQALRSQTASRQKPEFARLCSEALVAVGGLTKRS